METSHDWATQTCPQCGQDVKPTEIERDPAGWFAAYDHCGLTWTQGFNRDGSIE